MSFGGGIEIGGNINTLGGVQITNPIDGQILIYVAATQTWVNANNTPGAASLAGLTDVTLTSPTANDFLVYNGTKWVNLHPSSAQVAIGLAIGTNVEAWSASLDALAALSSTGLVVQTGANTFTDRTITGTSGTITVTDGNGVSGNPSVTIDSTYAGQSSITTVGTVATGTWEGTAVGIAYGGTGQTAQTAAFDALSPLTTKGDIIVFNGTHNVRIPVGTDGYVLQANSSAADGLSWILNPAGAYDTIQNDGVALTERNTLNFSGSGITAVDNAGAARTDVALATNLVDIAGLTPTANTIIYGTGTVYASTGTTNTNVIFISTTGNDTTGDGSQLFPYLTIYKANSVVTGNTAQNQVVIYIEPGRYHETQNILLKPFVTYFGYGSVSSYITSPNNIIGCDPSYNTGSGRSSLVNIYIGGSTSIDFDLDALGSGNSGVLDMYNSVCNGGITFTGRVANADELFMLNCYAFGNLQVSNCAGGQFNGSFVEGNVVIDTADTSSASSNVTFQCFAANDWTFTSTGALTNTVTVNASTCFGTMTATGTGTNLSIDAVSLPTLSSAFTVTGATVNYYTSAYGINAGYTPTHYTAVNTSVEGNLAGIDNALGSVGFAQQQARYVAPNGNDTTGNGSSTNPYLTIGKALNSITDSSSTNPYVVFIGPGTYSETGLQIPVWVFLQGSAQQATKVIDSTGAITISSAAYNNGSQRLGFSFLNLINSTGLTIDFQAIGGSGSNDIYLFNNEITGNIIFRGRGSDYVTGYDNQLFGTYASSAMQEVWYGGYFANNMTFDTMGVTSQAIEPEFTAVNLFGSVSFTSSGSGNTMQPTLLASQISSTLTIDQATTTLSADALSLNAATVTITNGGVITYLTLAKYVNASYSPTNYTAVSSDVTGNLHGIDNAIGAISGGAFPWTSVAGTSQALVANNGYFAANSSLTTFTLPSTANVGDTYKISADGAGLFMVAQNASQSLRFAERVTTVGTGGSITATAQGDTVEIVCKVANTEFQIVDSVGNYNFV